MINSHDAINDPILQPSDSGAPRRSSKLGAAIAWLFIIMTVIFTQTPEYRAVKTTPILVFFGLHLSFYQNTDEEMQELRAIKGKNALKQPISLFNV
jgi:hypothetical protein